MDKQFDPARVAAHWYPLWEQQGYFKPQDQAPGTAPFCIALPPPNVTGTLHMGHGFQVSLIDALIRYHRMLGEDVLWQGGTDHAGIATQMVVERQLEAGNQSREDLGREEFVRRVWDWKEESGDTITRQLRRLGASIDWSRQRFTMDEDYSDVVTRVFVQLHEEGLIYRDKRLVNWDPVMLTALSDLEVVAEEEAGTLYHVRYPFVETEGAEDGENDGVIIATTRPETILVDGAIAVHPDDERFRPLLGRKVWVPMTDPPRAIEIIADEYVDPEFGSGCVKITAAHDFDDYQVYKRHPDKNIPLLELMTPDACMNDNAPEKYRGMDRYVARQTIVEDLRTAGLLLKEEPHKYKLPRGDRSGAVLEPMLTEQWFMGMRGLADKAKEVAAGEIRFVPEQWRNTFNNWLDNIQDWCLSRQLWWGHRIPAWYDDAGRCWVAADEAAARQKAQSQTGETVGELRQDDSVLDTWFSSSLWSFVPLGWKPGDDEAQFKRWHPTQVLVTAFDIIFFWVARMVMMSLHLLDEVPFKAVFVHGLVLDMRGKKMSKTRGNILDPIDLIDGIELEDLVAKRTAGLMQPQMRREVEERTRKDYPDGLAACGADALRFTFCALATTGRNVHFDTRQIEGYRNFCNKIWNAARFVLRRLEAGAGPTPRPLVLPEQCRGLPQRWILSRLDALTGTVREGLDSYRLDLAAQALYNFAWHQYCDWYLECAKSELDAGSDDSEEILAVMAHVLERLLRLAHPFIPFITEELWQKFVPWTQSEPGQTVMLAKYPEAAGRGDLAAEADFELLRELVGQVRNLRGETGIHPTEKLRVLVRQEDEQRADWRQRCGALFASLAGTQLPEQGAVEPPCSPVAAPGLHWLIPIGDLVDIDREKERLTKAIAQLQGRIKGYSAKLDSGNFVERAPKELVDGTREQLQNAQGQLELLRSQLDSLGQ